MKATETKPAVSGRFVVRDITDPAKPVVLADESNAVHAGNMAKHLAFALAGAANHAVHAMVFGYAEGDFEHRTANVSNSPSSSDAVTGPRYGAVVNRVKDTNYSVLAVASDNNYADIVTTCTIPVDAAITAYNEIGILGENPDTNEPATVAAQVGGEQISVPAGILLVHKIFEDSITKPAGSVHEVVHTLRIRM